MPPTRAPSVVPDLGEQARKTLLEKGKSPCHAKTCLFLSTQPAPGEHCGVSVFKQHCRPRNRAGGDEAGPFAAMLSLYPTITKSNIINVCRGGGYLKHQTPLIAALGGHWFELIWCYRPQSSVRLYHNLLVRGRGVGDASLVMLSLMGEADPYVWERPLAMPVEEGAGCNGEGDRHTADLVSLSNNEDERTT